MVKLNKKGSVLIIAIISISVTLLIAIYLLEKIYPISQNIKGAENSNIAYYEARSGIEEATFGLSKSNPSLEPSGGVATTSSGYTFSTQANTTTIPASGKGNSDYDKDWNKIGTTEPVQLTLPSGINWTNIQFIFRIPDLNGNGTTDNSEQLSDSGASSSAGVASGATINWILSGSGNNLVSSGSQITYGEINNSTAINIGNRNGLNFFTITESTLKAFYDTNCTSNFICSLKLVVIRPLILTNGTTIPYIEYKISGFNNPIPSQYTEINSSGYSNGFKITTNKKIKQFTSQNATDFTLFQ